MRTTSRVAILLAVTLGLSWMAVPSALADEESIRHLDAQFAVQPDGTMRVRYELQWHFAERGKRGINFGIVTRESWDQDPMQDAVYAVSELSVSSPSGAPAQYLATEEGSDSDLTLDLRIGDPDVTLDTQDHTYVIEYTLDGALRTFNGRPEIFWDVIGQDYPPVERLTATVTGPEGVLEARCLVGPSECDSTVDGAGTATYSATDVRMPMSVVAAFPPGSVANAEPTLERRRLTTLEVQGYAGEAEVLPDGSVDLVHRIDYEFPADSRSHSASFELFSRLPWSDEQDQAIEVLDISVVDEDGAAVPHSYRPGWDDEQSRHIGRLRFEADRRDDPQRHFTVSFRLVGAVVPDGDTAHLRTDFAPPYLHRATNTSWRLTLPAEPSTLGCLRVIGSSFWDCELGPRLVDGATVMLRGESLEDVSGSSHVTDITFPASAVPGAVAGLEPSIDAAVRERERTAWFGGLGAAVSMVAAGVVVGRFGQRRDERYGDVAPGLVGSATAVRPRRSSDKAPVQFTPPRLLPLEAGALLHRRYRDSHLAATLVHLAVQDAVRLGSKPLKVVLVSEAAPVASREAAILRHATHVDSPLPHSKAQAMREQAASAVDRVVTDHHWFQPAPSNGWRAWTLLALGAAPWAVLFLGGTGLERAMGHFHFPVLFGAIAGGMAALIVGALMFPQRRPLRADGTVLLEQVEGFRQYIATAEADQLDFEADHDIFRRYLPWAVLFDLTDRWTEVCRELERQGRIQVDTSFMISTTSVSALSSDLSSFSSEMSRAARPVVTSSSSSSSSSGGSGGSSGFSSSSSGGGGGGGTSASSW